MIARKLDAVREFNVAKFIKLTGARVYPLNRWLHMPPELHHMSQAGIESEINPHLLKIAGQMTMLNMIDQRQAFALPRIGHKNEIIEVVLAGVMDRASISSREIYNYKCTFQIIPFDLRDLLDWDAIMTHTYDGHNPHKWSECSERNLTINTIEEPSNARA